ncbi:hypothetical protein [Helicobacter cetorum]|uniref:hypothetical protein n=1 Tax=Helicobacter cetorum TaxID=138563 RepID=UPI000CF1A972|nr:hypothetical protein [Helicobacter cetorum]
MHLDFDTNRHNFCDSEVNHCLNILLSYLFKTNPNFKGLNIDECFDEISKHYTEHLNNGDNAKNLILFKQMGLKN